MRTSKPITVTLGKQQAFLEDRLASGEYESASEIVRAGLRALEREQKARLEYMRAKVKESLDDPRPSVPAEEVFERLRARHEARLKEGK
jgi:antitoxin ParD1/3/4